MDRRGYAKVLYLTVEVDKLFLTMQLNKKNRIPDTGDVLLYKEEDGG